MEKQDLKESLLNKEEQKVAKGGDPSIVQDTEPKKKKDENKEQDHAWGSGSKERKGV